ncbi:MAG TPA: CoA ester lyase [Steroidobacteraceae bacterium]|jgi:citrate lyase subunit beta/citryl-CoA lyase
MTVPFRKRWRSLLFVPANSNELLQKAALRGADALILDLEDAVPQSEKARAREALAPSADALARQGVSVLVRINHHPQATHLDVAALSPSVSAVVLPKAESAGDVAQAAEAIHRRERELGLASGAISLVPQIESPKGLRHAYEIAEAPRVVALSLGTEDFALALGVEPRAEALTLPAQVVCLAAAAAGIMGLALPTSIANFRDLGAWEAGVRAGRALGASGALCIHPAQIPILNEVFSPCAEERAWAEAVVEAWTYASGEGKGVIAIDGQMIDEPVFQRALATLRYWTT